MGLTNINYENFQGAIKRFGYIGDLNVDQMKQISKQINLEINEVINNEDSVFKIYYGCHDFTYDEKC